MPADQPGVRQLGSKLLAGGLSAGVVLLWWPMFFPTDSATTWLGRGVVWTLAFELLLVALSPFELALWSTDRGERISRRVEAKRALLDHDSPNRRIGRRAALAISALALPLALIGVGASAHIPTHHSPPAKVMQVTRVVRVVKPVRIQRVVKIRTVSHEVPVYTGIPTTQAPPVRTPARSTKPVVDRHNSTTPPLTPKAHVKTPVTPTTPSTPTTGPSGQNQTVQPPADQSGATAQPTT